MEIEEYRKVPKMIHIEQNENCLTLFTDNNELIHVDQTLIFNGLLTLLNDYKKIAEIQLTSSIVNSKYSPSQLKIIYIDGYKYRSISEIKISYI